LFEHSSAGLPDATAWNEDRPQHYPCAGKLAEKGNRNSVVTAGSQDRENHQVGVSEHSALCRVSSLNGSAHYGAEVFGASQVAQMFAANAGQAGNFFLGEDFLTRLDSDHGCPRLKVRRPFSRELTSRPIRFSQKNFIDSTNEQIILQ